jgi:prophage antirepressor-like protein
MPNEIQVFNNPDFGEVRTLVDETGKTLFCGKNVATALGYARPRDAIADHCKGAVKRRAPTAGGMQELPFIPEGDVYRLIIRSKLPTAEKFERWVFDEVLPSIRKNGGYIAGQETMSEAELMAKALMVAQRTLAEREAQLSHAKVQIAIMEPKADYFDELVERNTLTNFRETAKQLGVPPKSLVSFLLERKYLYRDKKGHLLPYEDKNNGLFEVKESFNEKTKWSGVQTLVTPKGRETFRLLYPTK